MEKQKSFRGFMEKQKSFRVVMEKQLSFMGSERKKSKESPGKRGDLPIHLAARAGNLSRVKEIIQNCSNNETKDLLAKQNLEGETPLYVASENGHDLVVSEILKYLDLQTASIVARNGYDPFHVAAKQGHLEVLRELLHSFPNLAMTTDLSNSTALHTAATQGHIDVVNLLLESDSNLAKIARNNGKTVLHSAARMGHLEVVKALLNKDPSTGFRTDKKGQTALHMAVKGQNEEILLELVKPDPAVLNLEDNKGNTALHIAAKKGRNQVFPFSLTVFIVYKNVRCLLSMEGININATNKAGETPLDIAEKFGSSELVSIMRDAGAANSTDQGKPPNATKQLKQTVSDIRHDVQSQLQQTRQTGMRVQKIAKKLKKLHISGLNNAINSATVVAVLIATVAFAAIFTVPGQYVEEKVQGFSLGQANIANNASFRIFFVFDSLALFISLAVVVVQTSVVVIEQKAKKQLVFVINKLMWMACLFISIAFISLTYVVVGSHSRWLAIYATVIGSLIMLSTIGSMCYCVILHRIDETKLRAESRSFSMSHASDQEILNGEYKRMYAL
ncbi:ankyrin repeat-containing protein At5g02620-like isoform X1 [Cicer arietinum]|uniref:Ankyrin repeat-containing protein At5g02620-like isoform X1 n=1 Tax=Cicer arietinum TaxID=3827 RepID=A0A1S2XUX3_CICAR|nr:ankyrin repeat-containing protein At5g02620-like isoform X1 [Cicer arietinum]XP_004494897.1 ankyrin repeat-containing protein At5g02620-like isoform X1 [Cicer arietinum]